MKGRFNLNNTACGILDGDFHSETLNAQMEAMAGVGYQVTWTKPGHWMARIEGEKNYAKRRQELRDELEQAKWNAGWGAVSREGEGQILMDVLVKIKEEKEPLRSCFLDIWNDWFQDRSAAWVTEDIASPKGSHKNPALYQQRMACLISSLRQFALLGCDSCYAAVQQNAWAALQNEVEARLFLLIKQAAAAEDVLAVTRKADLLGELSPAARERVWAYIKKNGPASL